MTDPLAPGDVIGILGGGQLGRMLAMAAARLGLRVHIYEPEPDCPASQVAAVTTTAPYSDEGALETFARSVAVVTYEFENVPTEALDRIEAIVPIRPGRRSLRISQDRLEEKEFLRALGLPIARFAPVDDAATLYMAYEEVGFPAILKTRRFGYDGKGQVRLSGSGDGAAALAEIRQAPAVLEAVVDFDCEVSVIAARGLDGATAVYDPGENVHEDGILRSTTVPSSLGAERTAEAIAIACRIMERLDHVGVMGVEMFDTAQGLKVNEFAPRVHNSGHWTQAGCVVDQFEQHIRAVAGLPLGPTRRHSDAVMENLIGRDIDRLPAILAADASVHLYGKAETRPGRKMGHVNRITGPAPWREG